MKKFLTYLIVVILINQYYLIAQNFRTLPHDVSAEIEQYIESRMLNKYGKKFYLSRFFIMDSLINQTPYSYFDPVYKDPYGKLQGISIFSCQKSGEGLPDSLRLISDSSIVGVFKDGNIIWDSGPIIYGNIATGMDFCDDINKDGIVDIGLVADYFDFYDHNPDIEMGYLWILSWDGINGRFINDYDINTGKSSLVPGYFNLFDWEGDGIYEIDSEWRNSNGDLYPLPENPPVNFPYVTYGWNGSKYGYWSSVYQLKRGDFYPAIWIEPQIRCKVKKENNQLLFEYSVSNGSTSKQEIEYIFITDIDTTIVDNSSRYKKDFSSLPGGILDNAWFFRTNTYSRLIKPGQTQSGYWYSGNGLPGISVAYVQGLTEVEFTRPITDESIIEGIYKNSVKTTTLGIKPIPQVYDSLGFIDTIQVNTDKSLQLGWIQTQQTADKYSGYLTTAKTALLQNNTSLARTNLQNILHDVDIDSSGAITSEAYALLRFNTEYLLSFLPQVTEPRNDLSAKASAEITTANGLLQYSYTITNEAASNQSAANIYVENTTTSTASAPVYWQTEKVENLLDRFYTTTNPITAGSTQSGYTVTSNSLPVIGKVYVQSERFTVDTTDIKTNSYIITTVVPSERPAQINASAFIDSMISYNNRAYSLGWMKYYWVRDNNYYQLNNARTMINMNVAASAVVILAAFEGWLDTCMGQSYFNKETYGLLKYNSIYLREKLSGQ